MADLTLVAETGRATGSRAAGRLRAQGKVPAIVYGHGQEPVAISIDRRELRHVLAAGGQSALITLRIGSTSEMVVPRALQRDPVKRAVTHVDFLRVSLDEEITVDVPLELTGESQAVKVGGGTVDLALNSLSISAKPREVPTVIEVDISALGLGDVLRVSDLKLPAGVTTALDPDEAVASVTAVHLDLGEAAEAPEAAAEGGEGSDEEGGD